MATEVVLVVEDDSKSRKLVRDLLTLKGYEIIEAETGEEGVGLAQERRPESFFTSTTRGATIRGRTKRQH
jgi:two-component system, cell cycle response regulator DivK